MLHFRTGALAGALSFHLSLIAAPAWAQIVEPEEATNPGSEPRPEPSSETEPSADQNPDTDQESSPEPETNDETVQSNGEAEQPNTEAEPSTDPQTKPKPETAPEPNSTPESEPTSNSEEKLVPRLRDEEEQPETALPAPIAQLERDRHRVRRVPTRQEEMPGDYVARPLTLPRGTFLMEFGHGLIFAQAESVSALAPAFSWGITEDVEIGADGPVRFDAGLKEWTALDPRGHLAVTLFDQEITEIGVRLRGLVPVTTDVDPTGSLAVPVRIHTRNEGRIDIEPEVEAGVGDSMRLKAFLPIAGSLQFSDGVYGGLMARPHVGITNGTKTGVDGQVLLGLTHQSRNRAYVDIALRLFMKNIAGGEDDFSDGVGGALSLTFFPELY